MWATDVILKRKKEDKKKETTKKPNKIQRPRRLICSIRKTVKKEITMKYFE